MQCRWGSELRHFVDTLDQVRGMILNMWYFAEVPGHLDRIR